MKKIFGSFCSVKPVLVWTKPYVVTNLKHEAFGLRVCKMSDRWLVSILVFFMYYGQVKWLSRSAFTLAGNGRQYDKCGTRLHCIFKPAQMYLKFPNVSTFTHTRICYSVCYQ